MVVVGGRVDATVVVWSRLERRRGFWLSVRVACSALAEGAAL